MKRLVEVQIDDDFLDYMQEPDIAVSLTNDICDKSVHIGACYGVMIAGLLLAGIGTIALALTNKAVAVHD